MAHDGKTQRETAKRTLGLATLGRTLGHLRNYRNIARYLIAGDVPEDPRHAALCRAMQSTR